MTEEIGKTNILTIQKNHSEDYASCLSSCLCTIPDCIIRYTGTKFARLIGYEEHQLFEKDALQTISFEDGDCIRRNIAEALRARNDRSFRCRILSKDGIMVPALVTIASLRNNVQEEWPEASVKATKDASSKQLGLICIVADVGATRMLQTALRNAEEQYESLVNNLRIGVMRTKWGPPGRALTANRAVENITGYTREEMLQLDLERLFVNPQDRGAFLADVVRLGSMDAELRWKKKNGDKILVLDRVVAVKDENGQISHFDAIFEDITEQKRTLRSLQESEQFSSTLLESSPNPIVVTNPDTSVRYVNLAFQELTKFNPSDVLGKAAPYPWWPKKHLKRLCSRFGTETEEPTQTSEEIFHKKTGQTFWVQTVSKRLTVPGQPECLLSIWLDITKRKRQESQINRYQKKLRDLSSQLSLAEQSERRRLAVALHDRLCQGLFISSMRLEALLECAPSERDSLAIKEILDLMTSLTTETRSFIFDLSSPLLYEIGLEAALERLAEEFATQHGIECVFQDNGERKPISQDVAVLLFQAVRELLMNVVKHAHAKHVRIITAKARKQIHINVEDDGVGLLQRELQPGKYTHRGFGLFAVRERIRYIGGQVKIKSKAGFGTRITLTAPLKEGRARRVEI
jgi:PAS domain S-box-containing protein